MPILTTWRDDLERDGFVVIPGVISHDKAARYTEKATQWVESFGLGYKRDDPSTWCTATLPWSSGGGLMTAYSVGHEDWVWEARQEPAVIDKFAQIWGTEELLVSFDAINFNLPIGPHARTDVELTAPWPHIDQQPFPADRPSLQLELIQGLLVCTPAGPDDGGLVVVKGSSNKIAQYFAQGGFRQEQCMGPRNFYTFTEEDMRWFASEGCETIKLNAEPGSLILWDSRTIHYNAAPTGNQLRHVIYTCYAPRAWATLEALEQKKAAFENWSRTSHWPHIVVPLNRMPERDGKPDPHNRTEPINKPQVTDKLLKLAGVKPY
ncbi:hypothetical protein JCM1840_006894 [Sporobolomyces johnsonii]